MPKPVTSDETMKAAIAALPDGGADLDGDLIDDERPIPEYETDDSLVADPDEESATPVAPAAAAKTGEQPPAGDQPAAAPAAAAATGEQPTADPWAEYDEVEYEDADTSEKFKVRAPKAYADKIKNGYARRSVMDRNSAYLKRNKTWLEPLVENGALDRIGPVIQRANSDEEFARFVTNAYNRRLQGLPLTEAQAAVLPAAPTPAAPIQPAASAPDAAALLARVDALDDVDDYTKSAIKRAMEPLAQAYTSLQTQNQQLTQGYETYQQAQARVQQEQQTAQRQQAYGARVRQRLMETFPSEFNEQTPGTKFKEVWDYAHSSGMVRDNGDAVGTYLLAAQALRNPMGLAGLGQAATPSVAARTIAEVEAQGARLAQQAVNGVAQATAARGTAVTPPAANAKPKVPRYVKDAHAPGGKRPMTPNEIYRWMEKHGGAA